MTQPFAGGEDTVAVPEVEPAYPAGLEVGRTLVAVGRSTDDGSELWLAPSGGDAAGDLPAPRPGVGRRAHPRRRAAGHLALRARRPALPGAARAPHRGHDRGRPAVVAEKWDGEGRGLHALEFGPLPDDRRLLVGPRAARPRGAADLGRRRRHRDRDRARPARRRDGRLVPRRLGAAGRATTTPRAASCTATTSPAARWRSWTPRRASSAAPPPGRTAPWSWPGPPPRCRR